MTAYPWHCKTCKRTGESDRPVFFHRCPGPPRTPGQPLRLAYRFDLSLEEENAERTAQWADKTFKGDT